MWWNFVGRNQEDIEQARHEWQGLAEGSHMALDHGACLLPNARCDLEIAPGPRPPS